jgi:hypothetical protein
MMSRAANNINTNKERVFFALKDLIPIVAFLLIAVVLFLCMRTDGGAYAELLSDNKVIERIDLSKDGELTPNGYNVVLSVKSGKIAFIQSDCPDKICVHTGYIGSVGQSAVCLPNRLTLRIVADDEDKNEDAIDTYLR